MCKQMISGLFKMLLQAIRLQIIYIYIYVYICMHVRIYKQDLALNNLQGLICHKTQPTNQK